MEYPHIVTLPNKTWAEISKATEWCEKQWPDGYHHAWWSTPGLQTDNWRCEYRFQSATHAKMFAMTWLP